MIPTAGLIAMLVGGALVAYGAVLDAKPAKRRRKRRRRRRPVRQAETPAPLRLVGKSK